MSLAHPPEGPDAARAPGSPEPEGSRWVFLRDVAVFQLKLVMDGLRDAVLVPISLGAAVVDVVSREGRTGRWFYTTILQARRSEDWIDLFEAADRLEPRDPERRAGNVDEVVRRLEAVLVEQHERGGMTASARQAIDRLLDSIQK